MSAPRQPRTLRRERTSPWQQLPPSPPPRPFPLPCAPPEPRQASRRLHASRRCPWPASWHRVIQVAPVGWCPACRWRTTQRRRPALRRVRACRRTPRTGLAAPSSVRTAPQSRRQVHDGSYGCWPRGRATLRCCSWTPGSDVLLAGLRRLDTWLILQGVGCILCDYILRCPGAWWEGPRGRECGRGLPRLRLPARVELRGRGGSCLPEHGAWDGSCHPQRMPTALRTRRRCTPREGARQ